MKKRVINWPMRSYLLCNLDWPCCGNKEQCHKGPKMGPNGDLMAQCIENLPFSLTDQQRALEDIRIDMEDERPMQRLLQG